MSKPVLAILVGVLGLATAGAVAIFVRAILTQGPLPEDAATASLAAGAEASAGSKKPKRTKLPGPWRLAELAKDPGVRLAEGSFEGRTFVEALADAEVPKAQIYRVVRALDGLAKLDAPGKRTRFSVALDRTSARVTAFEYEVAPEEIYQAREGEHGRLKALRLDMKSAVQEVEGAFLVGAEVATSYQDSFEDGILEAIDEALGGRLPTDGFEEGGTARIIARERTALGQFARYEELVAIEYRAPDPGAHPIRFYGFTGREARGLFDEQGRQPVASGWLSPVPGARRTSKFNPRRMHPVLHKVMPHQGTDFGAATGTPVYAAYRGVVDWVGPKGALGNWVSILHPNGIETGYAHLSKIAPGLRRGDKIKTHALVGYVGSTGRSTGPHLHFSARRGGEFFDAETLLAQGEREVPEVDRAAFLARKADLDRRLDAIPLPEPPAVKPEAPPQGGATVGDKAKEPGDGRG